MAPYKNDVYAVLPKTGVPRRVCPDKCQMCAEMCPMLKKRSARMNSQIIRCAPQCSPYISADLPASCVSDHVDPQTPQNLQSPRVSRVNHMLRVSDYHGLLYVQTLRVSYSHGLVDAQKSQSLRFS